MSAMRDTHTHTHRNTNFMKGKNWDNIKETYKDESQIF